MNQTKPGPLVTILDEFRSRGEYSDPEALAKRISEQNVHISATDIAISGLWLPFLGARFVSYHYVDKPEIAGRFDDATQTIKLLSEG